MPILEIRNLQKSFRSPEGGNHVILDIPEFCLEAGHQAALEGSSGSGKTTLLNLIAGILLPDQGEIRIASRNIAPMSESDRDRWRALHIGYVFQTFNLLQGYTALENVLLGMMFGSGVDLSFAKELLHRVGLSDRMNYRPGQLSVGQQQRVALARAVANHPQLVLADEPTGNLDRQQAQTALGLLRDICRENGAALLLVSHDPHVLNQFEERHSLDSLNCAAQGGGEE
ncbi:ABC transporter ATP-binding protein [bacterium]|nr:MAG: putative ABC transporter ATP-binding protein [Candidatus Hinthialibacteria bacterium OLB16]MCK6497764.1 ABC transporter ATP-binding protein [bacterium]NUP93994.1 ABC transporter ATP-binding protein [Candidatus Omnitrophota bacterium]